MDKKIVILTATYNHGDVLSNLYNSLVNQNSKQFKWLVVNDGSKDNTDLVINSFIDEGSIDIEYIKKTNTGKSSSLNTAFDRISNDQMAVIVDDDEQLDNDAVNKIYSYYNRYYNSAVGVIHFQRRNILNMEIIVNYDCHQDLIIDYINFKDSGKMADGYIAYFGYALKELRFPIYDGEKYVGPGVLLMMCCEKYNMVWAKEAIGTTEYLEGGITKQGRKLRIKNPLGMMKYCELYQKKSTTLKTRIKYSVMGYAYKFISKKKTKDLLKIGINCSEYICVTKPIGVTLGMYWKKKYSE